MIFNSENECEAKHAGFISVASSNENLNRWLCRSQADIASLISQTSQGPYPFAGTPWFSAPFGRDGIFTALQTLWVNPSLGRDVLSFLAQTQAQERDPYREAEPGKILHEARFGEMVNLGELPYKEYYGSIDATPLYIVLAGEYLRNTGDMAFIYSIWESLLQAISWIESSINQHPLGFLAYVQSSSQGLLHHGWKDSYDCVYHRDGKDAKAPIALCEVQAYVYSAFKAMAKIADARELLNEGERWRRQAQKLRRRFNQHFWLDELATYALALDGQAKPCQIRSSNAGHTLYSGICETKYVASLVDTLMGPDSFCGWGIRTIAASEKRFNPMSYHNGSVWPHDTAYIAAGLSKRGYQGEALALFEGMFAASQRLDQQRMPELFCGFDEQFAEQPILYPFACAPQAWAAGAVFMLIQSFLGMQIDGRRQQVRLFNPKLPADVDSLVLSELKVGPSSHISLEFRRSINCVSVNILDRHGDVKLYISK